MDSNPLPWPHAPTHKLDGSGAQFVTVGTYLKQYHFRQTSRLEVLHRGLLTVAQKFEWQLEAWAVFSNHYHFIAKPPKGKDASSLPEMIRALHGPMSRWVNRLDGTPGRQVFHNYWDTTLSHPTSYLARLNYTHQNPVKHGLVTDARDYPWCSAGWFHEQSSPAMIKAISRFKTDTVTVDDDFEPELEAAR